MPSLLDKSNAGLRRGVRRGLGVRGLAGRAAAMRAAGRRGLTLMELLVVIFLLGLITAATIPIMNPQAAPRRIREGARLVSTVFGTARNRALAEGRPVGVIMEHEKSPFDTACFRLSFAEQPQPYSGESVSSLATVNNGQIMLPGGTNMALINVNDTIRLNYQGHIYSITAKSGSTLTVKSATAPGGVPPNTPSGVAGVPFQVFRQPIKSAEKPVQLPAGIVIDFVGSGFTGQPISSSQPFIVMFNPGGAIGSVYNLSFSTAPIPAPDTLFLLIGRSDGLLAKLPNDPNNNVNNAGSIWVTVGSQTGLLATVENYVNSDSLSGSMDVDTARTYALTRTSMGGK
jgi:prepilin-type N-terminal cleavage/methylation domain-containing protein